jgi:hypothetical protein
MKIIIPKNTKIENKPTNYIVLTDLSGSMWHSVTELKKTLLAVADLATSKDTLTIGYFSGYRDYDFFIKGLSLADKNLANLIEKKVYARGLTCYTESMGKLADIVEDLKTVTGNDTFAFYFLSDGHPNDNSPEKEIYRICSSLKGKFAVSKIVGFGNYYNRNVLLEMAEKIGGQMNHISDYTQIKNDYLSFFKGKKAKKNVKIDKKYDLIWQVCQDIIPLEQKSDNSVDVLECNGDNELFGVNYSELKTFDSIEDLDEGNLVYSLAYILSQQNKANLGVALLRKAGDFNTAKMLQKAFTVAQKGKAENVLKELAIKGGKVKTTGAANSISLKEFISDIESGIGRISIDLGNSKYTTISRKGDDISKVEFKTNNENPKIVSITGNENRPNISFLTARKGSITKVNDKDLATKIAEFNKANKSTPITLPIEADTFRNYAFIANGDFNFEKISLEGFAPKAAQALIKESKATIGKSIFDPSEQIDLFDEEDKNVKIKDFVNLYKTLLQEKIHASVLRFYVKENSEQKQLDDLRVKNYGEEGAKILEEMGLDYQMRYAPKKEYKSVDETQDYIPFTEISAYLEGASKISGKDSYAKYEKKGKKNAVDEVAWPLFERYDKMLKSLGKETFVETIQTTLKGVEKTCDLLSNKLAAIKFYLITTNSWFDGVDKTDEIKYDGLVIKVKETKEYI